MNTIHVCSVAPERQFASEAKIELNNYSFDQNLSADDDLRKKWVSSRKVLFVTQALEIFRIRLIIFSFPITCK